MNEIKHIYLGQRQFTIAVEAHRELNTYLKAIETALGADEKDVLEEVELRMAELLTERGLDTDKVVTGKDVSYLREQLGRPQDFAASSDDGESAGVADAGGTRPRRLFRDTTNSLIAGVAAGLAAYLRVSPLLVRIGFVVLSLFKGFSLLLYALLWFLMPEAKSASDRLQMRGEVVTIQNLRQAAEQANLPQAAQRISALIRRLIEIAFKVVAVVIGVVLALGSCIAIIAIWIIGTSLLGGKVNVGGVQIFPIGTVEHALVIVSSISLTLLGILLLILGISSLTTKRRWLVPSWVTATLLSTMLVGVVVTGCLVASVAPDVEHRYQALRTSIDKPVASFSKLNLTGDRVQYEFVRDDTYEVQLTRFGKIQTAALHTDVQDDTLRIDAGGLAKASDTVCHGYCFRADDTIHVIIHAPRLTDVELYGYDSNLVIGPLDQTDDLHLAIDSRGSATVDGATAGQVTVDGTAPRRWQATLGQLRQTTDAGELLALYPQRLWLSGTIDQLSLQLPGACRPDESIVGLQAFPNQLSVNGQIITADQLSQVNSKPTAPLSLANCLNLTTGQ